jgi:hypothetical protein
MNADKKDELHIAIRVRGQSTEEGLLRSQKRRVRCSYRSPKTVRNQTCVSQIVYHNPPVKRKQLQRKLKEYTNRGRQYKQAYVKGGLSAKNKDLRRVYGENIRTRQQKVSSSISSLLTNLISIFLLVVKAISSGSKDTSTTLKIYKSVDKRRE